MEHSVSPVSSQGAQQQQQQLLLLRSADDKENADPRLTHQQQQQQATEKKRRGGGGGVGLFAAAAPLPADGFDVGENLQLDSDKDDGSDVENNPMASLIRNRVVFVPDDRPLNLCSDSAENGASPLFLNQPNRAGGFRRCVSMVESANVSPVSRNPTQFKRPAAPTCSSETPVQTSKRRRALHELSPRHHHHPMRSCSTPVIGSPQPGQQQLSRSKSMLDSAAAAQILEAVSLDDDSLTGDKRTRLSLPTIKVTNKNCHFSNIDCHTLAGVMRGEFDDRIGRCRILDARYCYEYEGGHIRNAENFGAWDEEAFFKEFFPTNMRPKPREESQSSGEEGGGKRDILVFHCEFSSARGPALLSKLRNRDRKINQSTFPALHYPECYLLHEGYKKFFHTFPELCVPESYVPMDHKDYAHEERKFHRKSKSWAAGGGGTVSRTGASSRLLKL